MMLELVSRLLKVPTSQKSRLLVLVLFILQGCSTTPVEKQSLPQWLSDYSTQKSNGKDCEAPVGTFWVDGSSSDKQFEYPLHHILFEDRLAGYPVEQVKIEAIDDNNGLKITGVLAGVPLNSSLRLAISDEPCEKQWFVKVDSGAVNFQLRTEAILWTGGLLVPLSETNHVYLIRAQDGALLIHLFNKVWVLGALSIPFKVESEVWLRYYNVETGAVGPDRESSHNAIGVER